MTQAKPMQETQRNSRAEPFAFHEGRVVSLGNLWADVAQVARRLPNRPYLLNLCENRYLFSLALLAAASRGQVCLLPPSGQAAAALEILAAYPGAYVACEHAPGIADVEWFNVEPPRCGGLAEMPVFDWKRTALVAFTSGSTGKPKPCPHSLSTFRISAEMALASLGLGKKPLLMVSTTPPQHMYGLETSIFWPLFSRLVLHDGRPFYPEDIRHTIGTSPWDAVLACTPAHLRSLAQSRRPWPRLACVISATDTLPETLAREAEDALGQSLLEIYGSTETLSFANREPLRESLWRPYPGVRLARLADGQTRLVSPHLPEPVVLHDCLQLELDGRFAVLGRPSDLVKIGGKRGSLAELNRRLKGIDGVEDGFCYLRQGRLAAVVVSRLDKQAIREGLRPYVDEVFLPRAVHHVQSLPRNAVGKLAQAELEKLLETLSEAN